MNERNAPWLKQYARQADADFRAWELLERHPEALAADCHKLLFLQMACEKLCKAHLIGQGTSPSSLQSSHGYIAKPLPVVIREQLVDSQPNPKRRSSIVEHVKRLAREIEVLNPSITRDGLRPDNCEYPWAVGGQVKSPLDWTFHPLQLCTVPAGRTFLKLVRAAINQLLYQ